MNIPMKYEDVVAQLETERARVTDYIAQRAQTELKLDAALGREAALREELGALEEEFDTLEHTNITLKLSLNVAEQRLENLSGFSKEIINAAFDGGSLDGAEIQDIAVKHGLLKIENRTEECGEACACREFGFPSECYRKTDLIALKPAAEREGS